MKNSAIIYRTFGIKQLLLVFSSMLLFFMSEAKPRWFDFNESMSQESVVPDIMQAPASEIDTYNQDDGNTGLMTAAARGYLVLARAFLARNANVFLQQQFNFFGWTPLHLAVCYSNKPNCFEIVKMLIENGTPVFVRDQIGETPFHTILQIYNYDIRMAVADYLISQGAQINAQDQYGNTMMHDAVQNQDKGWIRIFRAKYGNLINTQLKNNLGYTLIEYAQFIGQADQYDSVGEALLDAVPLLQGEFAYKNTDSFGRNGLMYAIYRGDIALAKEYIQKGADVNAQDARGDTALHIALVSLRPLDSVRLLLENNAQVNIANNQGRTPLDSLLKVEQPSERLGIASLLVDKGAVIGQKDTKGPNILERAKQLNDLALINFLNQRLKK